MNNLDIVFEDDAILVCHKAAGVATQTKRLGQQDMESLLKNYRAKKGEPPYVGVVHRLDQPVEGVMVFAKTKEAAANLSKQVQNHILGKHYYAISHKAPAKEAGVLEDYLVTDKKMNVTSVVEDPIEKKKADCENGEKGKDNNQKNRDIKYAKLEYRIKSKSNTRTLFDITLHTGRQHQIRVQLSHMGCPILGDNKYGGRMEGQGLALCSYKLAFRHPKTGKEMVFEIQPKGSQFLTI